MAFDLASARPVSTGSGFDLSTAKRVTPNPPVIQPDTWSTDPTEGMSPGFKLAAGAGKAYVDMGHGIRQLGADIGAKIGLVSPATASAMRQQESQREQQDYALIHDPLGAGANAATNALLSVGLGEAAGAAPGAGKLMAVLGPGKAAQVVKAGAGGGALGAIQPVGTDTTRQQNVAAGALGGMVGTVAGQAIGAGAGMLKNKLAAMAAQRPQVPQSVLDTVNAARQAGIPLRAENVTNNKVLNGISAGLDYIPFSGAAASKDAQVKALNQALSRTVGEDTPLIGEALKSARGRLGAEYDRVLSSNSVKVDKQFSDELQNIAQEAFNELDDQQASRIGKKITDIMTKAQGTGEIDGQAAYNIKKSLDRMSNSNDTSVAHWAREMKGSLMNALSRSLGPDEAKAFETTRQQYGNMLKLENIAPANDAAAMISPARLANQRGIYTQDLKQLAEIANMIKSRVGDSGTVPRALTPGIIAGGVAGLKGIVAGAAAGRTANAALNSNALQNYLLRDTSKVNPGVNALLQYLQSPAAQQTATMAGIIAPQMQGR